MVCDIDAVLDYAQTFVIGNKDSDFNRMPFYAWEQVVIDFVRILEENEKHE
jgi:hypothetical protein